MANGNGNGHRANNRCEIIERQLETLKADLAHRSEVRDQQLAERRDEFLAQVSDINSVLTELATKVAAAEKASERAPSWLAILGTAATLAAILAGLAKFTLEMTVTPIEKAQARHDKVHEALTAQLSHYQADVTGMVKVVQERQDDVRTRLARIEGKLPEMDARLDDVDKLGSRKWINKGDRE